MSRDLFDQAAARYDACYDTPRGQRIENAERALLGELLTAFPGADSVLDVGCGTGRFAGWLAPAFRVLAVDRSPAMLAEMQARHPIIPLVLGDAHRLPLRDGAIDVALFVTTLEFLEDPLGALSEAVRVARRGLILVVLNRWSVGGLSRRAGAQARGALRGQARDWSLPSLRALAMEAAGARLLALPWASTLFPAGLWAARGRLPLGDVLGMAVVMAEPTRDVVLRFSGRVARRSARALRPRPCTAFATPDVQQVRSWAPLAALDPTPIPVARWRGRETCSPDAVQRTGAPANQPSG